MWTYYTRICVHTNIYAYIQGQSPRHRWHRTQLVHPYTYVHTYIYTYIYPRRDKIVGSGDIGHSLYIIERGLCRVFVSGVQVSTMKVGALFGEIALFLSAERTADVVAEGDVTVLK